MHLGKVVRTENVVDIEDNFTVATVSEEATVTVATAEKVLAE